MTNAYKLYIVYIYRRGDYLQIIISNSIDTPIYEQIASSIKESILKGELMGGECIPSIRSLAKDLRISNITTKRAYEELERDGFIEAIPGKGYFVKKKSEEFLKEEVYTKIEEKLNEALILANTYNIEFKEIKEMLDTLLKEE